MLKRPIRVPLFMASWPSNKNAAVGVPQPINEADKQRLVKLSDPQIASDLQASSEWLSETVVPENIQEPAERLVGNAHNMQAHRDQGFDAECVGAEGVSMQQVQGQLFSQYSAQQRLREVERRLRSSLNLSTIFGSTVVESAALFGARQVSLLRNVPGEQRWEQVAQFCENQALAWRPAFSIPQAEFSGFAQCLRCEQVLRLQADQVASPIAMPLKSAIALSHLEVSAAERAQRETSLNAQLSTQLSTEKSQWLACWSGSWLLVPVYQSRPVAYGLNGSANSSRAKINHADNTLRAERSLRGSLNGQRLKKGPSLHDVNLFEAGKSGGYAASEKHRLTVRTVGSAGELTTGDWEGNEPWGFMALAFDDHIGWSDSAISAAKSIALELELAMGQANQYQDLVSANQELQKLALSDGLTCLANRRRFDEHLADEWQRLARDQQPLSLILCDLDHFKRYNDSFGHPAGDRCLIRIARALLNGPQRPADLVARYGGEEFAIILPNTDTHGAWRIAKKIHDSIRSLKIAHAPDNESPYVTVTMGVSTVIPGHDTTPQMLVQASDLALYHAKQQGRNRTYVHAYYNTVDPNEMGESEVASESQPKMTPAEDGDGSSGLGAM